LDGISNIVVIGSVGYETKKVALIVDIAGRLGSNIRQTGDILINGRKQVLAYGTSVWKYQIYIKITLASLSQLILRVRYALLHTFFFFFFANKCWVLSLVDLFLLKQ
jgi:hypothetical protein